MQYEKKVRIGDGSGCAEDRIDAAVEMIERANLDYMCFDSLSENELSALTIMKLKNPEAKGYDIQLEDRMGQVLPAALEHKVKVIGNMGSTNPVAAMEYVSGLAIKLGYKGIKVAAVTGDNVRDYLLNSRDIYTVEGHLPVHEFGDKLVAANAYISSSPIVEALKNGANVVLTGRVGDSGLFLAPLRYEFGWAENDWDNLARGIVVGHQLECSGQLTGGYYADPPFKVVENIHRIGFPFADVYDNGDIFFSKTEGTGGLVSVDCCKEQIIYEVHDPSNYIHAEVIADISGVNFEQVAKDVVKLTGVVKGKPAPEKLKVALGVRNGYFATSQIWYGGPGARGRAEETRKMLYARFDYLGYKPDVLSISLLGINAMFGDAPGVPKNTDPWEVGVRMAARGQNPKELLDMVRETSKHVNTSSMAGGSCAQSMPAVREVVEYYSVLIPRDAINAKITYMGV